MFSTLRFVPCMGTICLLCHAGAQPDWKIKTENIDKTKTSVKLSPVADPGGPRGPSPSDPGKISHKKDGRQIRPHRFHVSEVRSILRIFQFTCVML